MYSLESLYFSEHLYRGLLMVDAELNVVPAMADNMRVSSDGREYLFRLREDARWSDGEPLKADDFTFAWQSMAEQQTITSFMLEDIEEANALDERTLEIRLREPRSYFPYLLSAAWSFPWPQHKSQGARRRLAQAGEPRRQRPLRARRAQRRARAHGRQPALGRAARGT